MGFDGRPKDRQVLECVRASAAFLAGRPKAELSFRAPKRFARKAGGLLIAFRPSHPSFQNVISTFTTRS